MRRAIKKKYPKIVDFGDDIVEEPTEILQNDFVTVKTR